MQSVMLKKLEIKLLQKKLSKINDKIRQAKDYQDNKDIKLAKQKVYNMNRSWAIIEYRKEYYKRTGK